MENEEKQEDTLEVDETTSSSGDENTEENTGDHSDLAEQLELERKAKQQLTARAKKAEADLKELKTQLDKQSSDNSEGKQSIATPDVDERVLKANGMADELLKELKVVAQVRGVGLIEAQSDPVFASIRENYEKEVKAKEASLGTSKGSGQPKPKKDFNTPGLSKDEHKELFKQRLG